jgi:tetratricopeptide (TPR) repeat protein
VLTALANRVPKPVIAKVVAITGVLALGLSGAFLAWSERGALLMREGSSLLDGGESAAATGPLLDAVRLDPAMTPYHLALGLALADSGDLEGARDHLATAANRDSLPESWLNLAAVQHRLGDAVAARTSLAEAWRLGYQQAAVALAVGELRLQLGDEDAAVEALARALALMPTLAGDQWWTATDDRRQVWPEVYSLALDDASAESKFVMGLEAGDQVTIENALGAMESDVEATRRLVASAWAGDQAAFGALESEARARPLDASLANWCALLLRRQGEVGAAGVYANWADTINGDSSFGGFEVRVAPAESRLRPAGQTTLYYGQFTYRRPVPDRQLVAWLPQLRFQ